MKLLRCPKCGSENIIREKRIDGNSTCKECGLVWKTGTENKPKQNIPQPLENIDFESIKSLAIQYRDYVDSDDYHADDDWKTWFFEGVLESVFGKDFWKWHNNK